MAALSIGGCQRGGSNMLETVFEVLVVIAGIIIIGSVIWNFPAFTLGCVFGAVAIIYLTEETKNYDIHS
jgi:hypothetical protein